MFNKYYEVIEPIHYFERKGHALSNTWVGRSQAYDTIFEGKNAVPGDQFHLLAGGDFILTEAGETPSVDFWKPKHLFEKSYGGTNSPKQLFEQFEKAGKVREIPAPDHKIDYTNISKLPTFTQGTRTFTRIENSPTFEMLNQNADDLIGLASDFGLQYPLYDFGEDRRAILRITDVNEAGRLKANIFEAQLREDGRIYIAPNQDWIDGEAFVAALKDNPLVDPAYIYKGRFWATDVAILKEPDLIKQLEIGLDQYLEKTNQKSVFLKP
ncbi:hypothetical protein [Mesorhizobium sp. SP-1A]|uniref:hypothetical protein n=1 Tax=Mesorhizobium sp. SP-1A TaxID=3077840 RepID=UPI0028F7089D|nr:hypothetical protein [Mesorhizobium sp. SP-1A]